MFGLLVGSVRACLVRFVFITFCKTCVGPDMTTRVHRYRTWAAMGNMFGSRTPTDLPEFKKPAVGESEN